MTIREIIALALLMPVGLAAYAFGWWWRGRNDRTIRHVRSTRSYTSRAMTDVQIQQFDATMTSFDKTFEEMGKLFKELNR